MKLQHSELTAYHINHWWWQKQEYASSFHDPLVSSSQWMRNHLQPSQPAEVAQFHLDDTCACGLEGLLSQQQQQWPEPGGGTGLSESCTMTSSHAEGTFVLRNRPPPSSLLRRTWDNQSSTRTQPHCDRSLQSWFLVILVPICFHSR